MPFFVTCSAEVDALGKANRPVNLDHCKSIERIAIPSAAIKVVGVGYPGIRFHGCDTTWGYADAAVCEADFARLSSLQVPSVPSASEG